MPLRYIVFSVLVLSAAFGVSRLLADYRADQDKDARPGQVEVFAESDTISGRSIAPGGAGGRQS